MKILLNFTEKETKQIQLLGEGDILILQNDDHIIHLKKKNEDGEIGVRIEKHRGFALDIEPIHGKMQRGLLLPDDPIELTGIKSEH